MIAIGRLAFLCGGTLEFPFGLQPIIKLIPWTEAPFEIDFMCAKTDLFTSWGLVC